MNKLDKFLFICALFLQFIFYAVLNTALMLRLPNMYISGGLRVVILSLALFLVVRGVLKRDYCPLSGPAWAFLAFALYYVCVYLIEPSEHFLMTLDYTSQAGGALYFAYLLFIVSFGAVLLFFMGRQRLEYFIERPWLVYVPSLLSVCFVLWVNRGALSELSLTSVDNDFANRSIVKNSMGALFAISIYYFIFAPQIWKKILLGVPGIALACLNLFISDSKSGIVSLCCVLILYAVLSLRTLRSFLSMSVLAFFGVFTVVPMFLFTRAWERLMNMLNFREMYYLTGDAELSRVDMIIGGWDRFLRNPVFGDGIYSKLTMEGSTHFLPLEVLVPTGLVGTCLFAFAMFGMARGIRYIWKWKSNSVWIFGISAFEISQQFMHGYTLSLFCFSASIFLAADCLRRLPGPTLLLMPNGQGAVLPPRSPAPPEHRRPRRPFHTPSGIHPSSRRGGI